MRAGDTVTLRVRSVAGVTEIVGTLVSIDDSRLQVRRRDGATVEIERAAIEAGRVVPPRPARAITPDELERIAALGWRAIERELLGEWILRASGGFTARANSCLAVGDPGLPLADAVAAVERWYRARELPPRFQAPPGFDPGTGWTAAVPDHVMTAEIAHVVRGMVVPDAEVRVDDEPDDAWLAVYGRDGGHAVLTGHPCVGFVSVPGRAIARVAVDGRWAGVFAVEVDAAHRRQHLGTAVTIAALKWAVRNGARHAYLQVRADNDVAIAMYERLGFATHHDYVHWLRDA